MWGYKVRGPGSCFAKSWRLGGTWHFFFWCLMVFWVTCRADRSSPSWTTRLVISFHTSYNNFPFVTFRRVLSLLSFNVECFMWNVLTALDSIVTPIGSPIATGTKITFLQALFCICSVVQKLHTDWVIEMGLVGRLQGQPESPGSTFKHRPQRS